MNPYLPFIAVMALLVALVFVAAYLDMKAGE